jgi:hypothetical protein
MTWRVLIFPRSPQHVFFLGPSILLSTIFRASANASVGVDHGFVAASFNPSSSCKTDRDRRCDTFARAGDLFPREHLKQHVPSERWLLFLCSPYYPSAEVTDEARG